VKADQNYDQWALTGDMSWSWDNSLPHFMLHEDRYKAYGPARRPRHRQLIE
jgi:hypothetical protein